MDGNGDFLKTTMLLGLGIVVGGVAVGHVLAKRPLELTMADLMNAVVVNGAGGVPDPIVTGSVGQAPPGKTIILDPCTGLHRN
jgi:hypothetical protein